MADSQQLQQFAVIKLEDNDIKAYSPNKKGEPDWIPLWLLMVVTKLRNA